MKTLEQFKEDQKDLYYNLFLEGINSLPDFDHRNSKKFSIRETCIDCYDGEGLEGWEDLGWLSQELVDYILNELKEIDFYIEMLTDQQNWIYFLEKAFGYTCIDFEDYEKDLK